jgi:ring-1,2-phenylacetyl-CoA epoxidase subunit PaaD
VVTPVATPSRDEVLGILDGVPDPELPVVSISELGMVHEVAVASDAIRVTLLPTFLGCPAIELIQAAVRGALQPLGRPVEVRLSMVVPWSSERITPAGRAALRAAGIAPPTAPGELRCPYCGAADVTLDNLFGPTQCRSLHYCRACRQPFEAIKPL